MRLLAKTTAAAIIFAAILATASSCSSVEASNSSSNGTDYLEMVTAQKNHSLEKSTKMEQSSTGISEK